MTRKAPIFQFVAIGNLVAFCMFVVVYLFQFGSINLSRDQDDWLYFFDFIVKPMTFIVAVSALVLSYLNYSMNEDKTRRDQIQSEMDRKLKMLEDLYSRYVSLKDQYEVSYRDFNQDFAKFQRQRESFEGDPEARWATDEEYTAMWHPYKKALLDMVDCQLTAFHIAKGIRIENEETKRIIRHYSTIFDYETSDVLIKKSLEIQLQKRSEPDLVDIMEMNEKLNGKK